MTKWITFVSGSYPPTDMTVLLYVVKLHNDNESLLDKVIISGFWNEEEDKFAYESIEIGGHISWNYFTEDDNLKVIAWTLPLEDFDYEKYIKKRKELHLDLFRKVNYI